jgi:uncharacterized protein (DUF1330 family)
MACEMLVALNVVDDRLYSAYRRGMTPILEKFGGGFRFDVTVQTTLKTELPHPVNRVFIISFPDAERKAAFFADSDYQKVKKEFFSAAVKDTAILSEINS